ncbi:hypothetical protein LCGC14_2244100 [marine sediment metagenome]|uniref:Uncharacterized protein n=1 Tax=marine sediment metagenome TaxID=412755 RepID=A0A0F9D4R0_9ZZZZ
MANTQTDCSCYVQHLDAQTRYVLHNGAHNPKCPWYRESGDIVDRKYDDLFRAEHEPINS